MAIVYYIEIYETATADRFNLLEKQAYQQLHLPLQQNVCSVSIINYFDVRINDLAYCQTVTNSEIKLTLEY